MKISEISNLYFEFDLYTKQECQTMLWHISNLVQTNYTVKLDGMYHEKGSSMKSQDLVVDKSTKWIFEKVKNYLSKKLDIVWLDDPHAVFRQYGPGDYFLEHRDHIDSKNADQRYFTITVQLSDPSEYTGGTVVVDRTRSVSKTIGSSALWGTNVVHEVKNIERGIRNSLIFFVSSKHIAINKTSLI